MEYAGYYSAAAANNYVDISSSSKSAGEYNGGGYGGYNGGDGGNKKNIALIIASVVAAVLVAAIVVFFCFYFLKGEGETKKTADAPKIFEFSANTKERIEHAIPLNFRKNWEEKISENVRGILFSFVPGVNILFPRRLLQKNRARYVNRVRAVTRKMRASLPEAESRLRTSLEHLSV